MLTKFFSYIEAQRFFLIKNKNCKVLFFKVPSEVLVSYLNYNIFDQIDTSIKKAYSITTTDSIDQQIYKIKDIAKLDWLVKSLKTNGVYNPVQLLKTSNEKYFCHPGFTKASVASYVLDMSYIEGFYVWHQEIDPEPFILDHWHKEITNGTDFYRKIKITKYSSILTANLTNSSKIIEDRNDDNDSTEINSLDILFYLKHYSDLSLTNFFHTALKCFKNQNKNFDAAFITYVDKVQWEKKIDLHYYKSILSNESKLVLGDITFIKENNKWTLRR